MGSGGWVIGVGLGGYEGRVHDNWEGRELLLFVGEGYWLKVSGIIIIVSY